MYEVWSTGYLAEHRFSSDLDVFNGAHLLIVGVKSHRELIFYQRAVDTGGRVTIVEPFAKNSAWARQTYPMASVHQITVQEYISTPEANSVTVVLWLQGPEHVDRVTALQVLERLSGHALVIAEMPHGVHEQGPDGGNPLETHRAYLYPADFDSSKWNIAVGPKDLPREHSPTENQHLLVWSRR